MRAALRQGAKTVLPHMRKRRTARRALAFRAPRRTRHLKTPAGPNGRAADGRSPGLHRAGCKGGSHLAVCDPACLPGSLSETGGGACTPENPGRHVAEHSDTHSCGGSDGLAAEAAHRSSLFIPCGTPSWEQASHNQGIFQAVRDVLSAQPSSAPHLPFSYPQGYWCARGLQASRPLPAHPGENGPCVCPFPPCPFLPVPDLPTPGMPLPGSAVRFTRAR